MASKFETHPGTQKCNRLQTVCINLHLMGFGWTPLFNQKVQFFPSFYSWCDAFNPNTYLRTNQSKPTCMQTGWRLWVTQKTILNPQYMNHGHQGEGDPEGRVQWYSLPNPELMVILDPSLTPTLSCCCSRLGEKSPRQQLPYFIYGVQSSGWCTLMMQGLHHRTFICHLGLRAWETSGGNWAHTHKLQAGEGHTTKF